MTEKNTITELNTILSKAVNARINKSIDYPILLQSLLDKARDFSDDTFILEETLNTHQEQFLGFEEDKLATYRTLEKREQDLKQQKEAHVNNAEFEQAAYTRDKVKQTQEDILQEIIQLHNFKKGFNAFNGTLFIITPSNVFQAAVIAEFWRGMGE